MSSPSFFGQKPIAFDPLSGSITVPSMPTLSTLSTSQQPLLPVPGIGCSFQYIIRDPTTARKDLLLATNKLYSMLSQGQDSTSDSDSGGSHTGGKEPLALLMIGSMERGNKVFRYRSYESIQLYSRLKQASLASTVPISGLVGFGLSSGLGGGPAGKGGM